MSAEAESLRRSKRNKFFLDVSALTASPERRKSQTASVAASPEPTPHIHDDSPGPSVEKQSASPLPLEEENKRSRRPTKNNNFVYADESDEEDESKTAVGMFGPHCCTKCPSRFETRPGLANHARLHGAEKRKFSCTVCDFSCGSSKAIRNHRRCHNSSARIIKEESPSQTHSDTRSDTSESHTPPQLTPVRGVPTSQTPTFGGPPQLDAISPSTEPVVKKSDKSSTRKRNRCPECPFAVRNRRRFEAHILSHRRTIGFQCHSCTLKTLSSGFLKRHIVEVHKETSYLWPPTFVNGADSEEKPAVSSDVEPPRPSAEKLEKRRKHRGKMLMRDAIRRENVTVCPVEGCSHECYSSKQLVFHKRRHHSDKSNRPAFRCSLCGLRLRSAGSLKLHRISKHPTQKFHPKAKKLLCSEAMPRFFLKHLLLDMAAKGMGNGLALPPTMDSAPSTPGTVSPAPTLTVSHSAPSLTMLGGMTVSSSLLGMDLPECLRGIDFDKAELETEFQKNQEHEFSCEECPFATSAKAKLERHVSRHQIKSDVQCPLCSFSCRGDDIIKTHVRLHMAVIHHQQQEAEKLVANLPSIFVGASPSSDAPSTPTPEQPTPSPAPSVGGRVTIIPGTGRINGQVAAKPTPPPQPKGGKRKAFPNTSFVSKGGMRMRRCLECPYVTRHSCDLLSHYNMHTTKPQRYKCTQCSYSTKRAVCLRTHYQSHREQNAEKSVRKPLRLVLNGAFSGMRTGGGQFRIYSCARCPFVSRTLVNLWHHMRSHLFRLDSNYKCSLCSFYGKHVDDLEDHLLLHEESASTERIFPPTPSLKRPLHEPKEKSDRPPKTRRVQSARVSPEPPVLIKEEPMEIKYETDESNDCKYESTASSSSSRSSTVPALDAPLSVVVEEFVKPEIELIALLRREHKAEELGRCPDCPFADPDELVMRIHREQHRGPPRAMKCDLCTFSCVTPEALHHHISLHLPALSPNSAAAERRKAAQRRRSHISELIPHGVPHFACTKCSFRTMTKDSFQEHMLGHAQELQRRLLTNMKRNHQETKSSKIIRRTPKKADKFYCCTVCSFRCETMPAYYRHQEMHTLNGMHKCAICSYSANTLSITQFHEMNHHSDHTLSTMTKAAVLAPHAVSLDVARTEDKIQKLADNVYRCNRCPEFICYEILDMRRHYESLHNETEADKQVVESLALGMLPLNSIVTLA